MAALKWKFRTGECWHQLHSCTKSVFSEKTSSHTKDSK